MTTTLGDILDLVGPLDDSAGEETSRERFRRHLEKSAKEVGQIRDYVDECLRTSGAQYNRALQDLVNHVGQFLGFEVVFGRYQGVAGQPGFDGHWKSPTGFHIVVEVKTTEVYSVKIDTLIGYVEAMISERTIPDWDSALGLYVIGRPDPEIRQLENAIVARKRTHDLRIISADSLLSLAGLNEQYGVSHSDVLAVLKPSGPMIDPVVSLISELVALREAETLVEEDEAQPERPVTAGEGAYWITPTKADEVQTAEECISTLVGREHVYAFGERTPGRKHIKPGDWMCFYATQNGIVGHARVTSQPERKHHPKVVHPEEFPWVFSLDSVEIYIDDPVVIDAALRSRLDEFEGRDPSKNCAWFVQATRKIDEHDFRILTRQEAES